MLRVSICDGKPEDKVKCGDGRGRNLQEKGKFKYFDYTGGIAPEFGNQMQVMLLCHLEGVVVAEVSVEDQVGQRNHPREPVQQGVEHAGDTHALRRACAVQIPPDLVVKT